MTCYTRLIVQQMFLRRFIPRRRRRARPPLAVLYDGLCPLCIRTMTILQSFDWLERLEYIDLESEEGKTRAASAHVSLDRACVFEETKGLIAVTCDHNMVERRPVDFDAVAASEHLPHRTL